MKRVIAVILCLAVLVTPYEAFRAEAKESGIIRFNLGSVPIDNSVTAEQVESTASVYYNKIKTNSANGTYGVTKGYSTTWFNSLEPLEIIVRLVYGQAKWWKADKQAMANLLWYRRYDGTADYCDEQNLYGVATKSGEFSSITGTSTETAYSRQPSVSSSAWDNTANYVSLLWATVLESSRPVVAMPQPDGYIGQGEYASYDLFFLSDNEDPDEVNRSHAFDLNNKAYYTIVGSDGTRTTKSICYIGIPGVGRYETVAEAKAAYMTKYLPQDEECVNIYFSYRSFLVETP